MHILSPVSRVGEARALAEAGADELYCGVLSEEWLSRYGAVGSINKREWRASSLSNYEELAQVVKEAHDARARVFLTLNQAYYSEHQYPLVLSEAKRAADAGVDAFIVADVGLVRLLRQEGFEQELHASSIAGIFNARAVEFYHRLGCPRVILPYNLRLSEIRALAQKATGTGVELEAFVLNGGCENVDAFCTFHHGVYAQEEQSRGRKMLACRLPYRAQVTEARGATPIQEETARRRIENKASLYHLDCGACAVWDFRELGFASVKIIGRGNPFEKELADVRLAKSLVELAERCPTRGDFVQEAAKLRSREQGTCDPRRCYYPEAFPWPEQARAGIPMRVVED